MDSFVKQKRAKQQPTSSSCVYSDHFKPEDFLRKFMTLPGQEKHYISWLKTDELEFRSRQ